MAKTDCRFFTGYKPCGKFNRCDDLCMSYQPVEKTLLVIHLGAMGAVVRTTSILPAIRKKFPHSYVVWLTDAPMDDLLASHPLIDKVVNYQNQSELYAFHFDTVFCIDKNTRATGIVETLRKDQVYGFCSNPKNGALQPATHHAEELWQIGLDDSKKFYKNKKTENQLLIEALNLGAYQYDRAALYLTDREKRVVKRRRQDLPGYGQRPIVGINTGCADHIPYKKLTIETHVKLIRRLQDTVKADILLLGGPGECERNRQIAKATGVLQTPTNKGVRDGLMSVDMCDIVFSGDSFGMHMALALNKYVIAWFGPTCSHEVEFHGQGIKIESDASCSPCWKRNCSKPVMCYDLVDLDRVVHEIQTAISRRDRQPQQNTRPAQPLVDGIL